MKISYDWLKQYVDIKASPEKLAEMLTMAGLSVESVSKLGDDSILEIEITANRPDWLSVIGVAREVVALGDGKLRMPKPAKIKAGKHSGRGVAVKVEDKKLCPRYTARVIRGVGIAQSPAWLRSRIEAMGLRSINNAVDITNFCLFETGEPMHAFDLDKLAGSQVIVRKARKGEKITTIDGIERALDDTMLVIADSQKPVAVAGVMGGLNTEVTFSTKNILLEAAYFDPISVRRTARKLGISTDSSYRFERRVDMGNIQYASDRATGLMLEMASGVAGEFIDIKAPAEKPKTITLSLTKLGRVLGLDIPGSKVKKIVTALGIKVRSASKDLMRLEAPGFRNDLRSDIDVIEEVARVFGYGRIPSTLPDIVEQPVRMERSAVLGARTRAILEGLGFNEIITYSLLSKKLIAAAGIDAAEAVEICNPLTIEQEAMRPSLVPGMLGSMAWNMNRKAKDLKLFELGNVYMKKEGGEFGERRHICVGMAGRSFESWSGPSRDADFFELKGAVEAVLGELGVKGVTFAHERRAGFSGAACAQVSISGKPVGTLGEVAAKTLHDFDIKERVFIFEADAESIFDAAGTMKRFSELPRYPSVHRDISVIVGKDTQNEAIISVIKAAAGPVLREARLIDRYKGKQIPEDRISLTYRLEYQDPARTLEDKDVAEVHSRVLRELDGKLGAKLR